MVITSDADESAAVLRRSEVQVEALLGALLFAVHPVHTEAVAGIVGQVCPCEGLVGYACHAAAGSHKAGPCQTPLTTACMAHRPAFNGFLQRPANMAAGYEAESVVQAVVLLTRHAVHACTSPEACWWCPGICDCVHPGLALRSAVHPMAEG